MDELKRDIIERAIDQYNTARGLTQFYSSSAEALLTFGSSSFYNHIKYSSSGKRDIDDTLSRFNKSVHVHEILTSSSSISLGITTGDYHTFKTITNSERNIRITIKDNDVFSIR